jgi:PTS system galactitol-specific IIA component
MNKVLELLEPSAVVLNYEARDAEEIISVLGEKLRQAGYVQDTFVAGALERERSMPTGLPLGGEINAAIPHTEIQHVKRAGLSLATLAREIPFHNMVSPEEEVPVRLVVLMALDQPKAQVEMLMKVSELLQNECLIQKIMQAHTYEDIRDALSEL